MTATALAPARPRRKIVAGTLEGGRFVGSVYPPRTRDGDRLMRSAGAPASRSQRIGLDDGAAGHALSDLVTSSGRDTVARTRTQGRPEAATSRQGRFARGATDQAQSPQRFARSAGQTEPARRFGRASARPSGGAPRSRRRQPEQGGAQKLMQGIRGMLPGGGGKSSAGRRSGRSIPGVGGLLSSLGGTKKRGAGRGRKPAMFGLLGAGAAGAAAAVAKRRHGSRSSQPAGETRDVSEAQATSTAATTPAHPAGVRPPDETAHEPDIPPDPDTPTAGDTR